jgi:hypothetical protein
MLLVDINQGINQGQSSRGDVELHRSKAYERIEVLDLTGAI